MQAKVAQITVDAIREFRANWDDGAVYATKNLERMRAFFRFCEQARCIDRNPAASVKAPKHKASPTLPFSADEMKRILDVRSLSRERREDESVRADDAAFNRG